MKRILSEVQSGEFAREFIRENQSGAKNFEALRKLGQQHPVEQVGAKLRDMMPWIKSNRVVDQTRN